MGVGLDGDFAAKIRLQQQMQQQGVKRVNSEQPEKAQGANGAKGENSVEKPDVFTQAKANPAAGAGKPAAAGGVSSPNDVQDNPFARANTAANSPAQPAAPKAPASAADMWDRNESKIMAGNTTKQTDLANNGAPVQGQAGGAQSQTDGLSEEEKINKAKDISKSGIAEGEKSVKDSQKEEVNADNANKQAENTDKESENIAKDSEKIQKDLNKSTKALEKDMKKTEKAMQKNDKEFNKLDKENTKLEKEIQNDMAEIEELSGGDNTGVGKKSANSLSLAGEEEPGANKTDAMGGANKSADGVQGAEDPEAQEKEQKVDQLSQKIEKNSQTIGKNSKQTAKIKLSNDKYAKTAEKNVKSNQKYTSQQTQNLEKNASAAEKAEEVGKDIEITGDVAENAGITTKVVGQTMQGTAIPLLGWAPTVPEGSPLKAGGVTAEKIGNGVDIGGKFTKEAGKTTQKISQFAQQKTDAGKAQASKSTQTGAAALKTSNNMNKDVAAMGKQVKTQTKSAQQAQKDAQKAAQMKEKMKSNQGSFV